MKPTEYIDADWLAEEIGKMAEALCFHIMVRTHVEHMDLKTAEQGLTISMTALDCLCDAIGRKLDRPFVVRVSPPGMPDAREMVLGEDWNREAGIEPEQETQTDD